MRIPIAIVCSLATLVSTAAPLWSDQMPLITGGTLSGKQISLPAATHGSVGVVCIGFSHASEAQLKPWTERLTKEFSQQSRVVVYSVAVLEEAPRLWRGMAVHAIKRTIPADQYDRFVVVYHGESNLKQITGFRNPDEAYILLIDRSGEVRGQAHGKVSDASFDAIRAEINRLLKHN